MMADLSLSYGGPFFPFSPAGRRWPEGSDEGACTTLTVGATPSSRCRDLPPNREKGQGARPQTMNGRPERTVLQPLVMVGSRP